MWRARFWRYSLYRCLLSLQYCIWKNDTCLKKIPRPCFAVSFPHPFTEGSGCGRDANNTRVLTWSVTLANFVASITMTTFTLRSAWWWQVVRSWNCLQEGLWIIMSNQVNGFWENNSFSGAPQIKCHLVPIYWREGKYVKNWAAHTKTIKMNKCHFR